MKKSKNKVDSKKTTGAEKAAAAEVTVDAAGKNASADAAAADSDAVAEPPKTEIDELKTEIDELKRQNAALRDQMLRTQAEAENFRKRMRREKDEFARFAREGFVRDLLPVKDNLERALQHAELDPEAIVAGVKMTLEQFDSAFKTMGVECVECEGRVFDPEVHEAMSQVDSDEHEPNTVVGELQKGYQLNGRLLRPAMVTVAKAKAEA